MSNTEVRGQRSEVSGRHYWRSLEGKSLTALQRAELQAEFEQRAGVAEWDPLDRRDFLRLMGASMALAGLTACTKQPEEKIVPYVTQPEQVVPGNPLFFATTYTLGGYAYGVLAESHMGRPTKLEGNPAHPASLGKTDAFAQASILTMYDPDRSQVLVRRGRAGTWDTFLSEMGDALALQLGKQGAGLRVLTETVTSPTMEAQLQLMLKQYPKAKWIQYEPVNRDNVREGAKIAFGEIVDTIYRFDKADVVLSLDADFLSNNPGHVRYTKDFASRRDPSMGTMNRLYVVESMPSITGASADHRLAVHPADVEAMARAIAGALGIDAAATKESVAHAAWIDAVVRDLKLHQGKAIVVAGDQQPAVVHALVHAINDALGNVGQTVFTIEPVEANPANRGEALAGLAADIGSGAVDILVILGANPVYYAPAELKFGDLIQKVKLSAHVGLYADETASLCHWHIPEAHYLEAWGDARAYDGTASIVQPLILPLYNGRAAIEVAAALAGQAGKASYDLVRETWQAKGLAGDFEKAWRKSVHDGVVAGTAKPVKTVAVKQGFASAFPARSRAGGDSIDVSFLPDFSVYDGRYANNGWLQEAPRPVSKLTWDNALLVSPATAKARGLESHQVVTVTVDGRALDVPVWVLAGHADDCATLHLGYGRTAGGRTAAGAGCNTYVLRTSAAAWLCTASIAKTGKSYRLVVTQDHDSIEGRAHLRHGTVAEYKENPAFAQERDEFKGALPPSIYPGFDYTKGNQWGMVINLSACTGCNACLVACQSENNIPVVGKEQVKRNREMHWIRIDRYFEGSDEAPDIHQQPLTCMMCENAPCENVCPVAATVHSNDGLNQMVYNRCVGTRYCSNNCPYKVRRFNFYKFADHETPSLKLMRNPDVTVRARGVMEKCTYCVQRISSARIEAKKQGRLVADGEVVTACQQACPADAIVFGDINDPLSRISKLRASPLNYGMLTELNTRPRTTYLAKVRSPNPELEQPRHAAHEAHG